MNENPFYHLREMEVERFYNRQSEVRDALGILRAVETAKAKGTIEVTGPRRIGRTWFLRYISHPTILQEYRIDPQRNICAYIDCQHRSIQQEEAQVHQRMLECIVDAAQRVGVDLVSEPRKGPFHRLLAAIGRIFRRKTVKKMPESGKTTVPPQDLHALSRDGHSAETAFEQALKKMHRRGLRTILLLDEFEVMARNPNLDVSFFNHLRALANADDVNVAYVAASDTSLVDLTLERKSLLGSPFFNIFQPIRLGLFSEQDCRHLVEDTLRRAGTTFPRDLLELVLEAGGRHPFFLQMTGHHAFKLAVTGEELTEDQRKAFLENVHREATRHFEFYWRKLDQQAQHVLADLPSRWQDQGYQEMIEHLKDECLIIWRNNRYDYFSPLFKTFVKSQKPEIKGVQNITELLPEVKDQAEETYRDFDLHIAPNGHAIASSVLTGQATADISTAVPGTVALLLGSINKRQVNADMLKLVGKTLYDWLFPGPIHTHFHQTEAVARHDNAKMRIRLRIEAEEIASLPLEFIYRETGGYFLAINPDTVLSRYLIIPLPPKRVRRREGSLHMLAIIADPTDQTRLPPDEWEAIIKEALAVSLDSGQMTLQTVKRATRKEIRNALLQQKPDIIQFVGHGIYQDGKGYLALVDEQTGKTWLVDDERFANLYLGHDDNLGLISLATCESAKSDDPQGFLGIAPKLVQRGVPAVLSMQYKVYVKTAKIFLEDFYTAVAARKPIDWATQSARNAVSQELGLDNREFATPVLYMRAKDGNIF